MVGADMIEADRLMVLPNQCGRCPELGQNCLTTRVFDFDYDHTGKKKFWRDSCDDRSRAYMRVLQGHDSWRSLVATSGGQIDSRCRSDSEPADALKALGPVDLSMSTLC